ncbi:MAG TPA: maltotransferase domain-containing protein, partial [Candidatus Nanopelagicales bacterium]|nr:maltotransferase domain-containing protein [Candidatus Nanopelagicales bacterium]
VDRWVGLIQVDVPGDWTFTVHAWSEPWRTWLQRAQIKIAEAIDVDAELAEGALLLSTTLRRLPRGASDARADLKAALTAMRDTRLPAPVRLAAATAPSIAQAMAIHGPRTEESASGPWPLRVQRRRALVGAWYEFFPRSEGASLEPRTSGTMADATKRLPAIAEMGFDVVYLPPIHPIGTTHRKGHNNSPNAAPGEPGSPWAIGDASGGHDSLHPDLGSWSDFDAFVAAASELEMEVAIDLALQASPDHPWVTQHPEWFQHKPDGSIAYAENPPKKYQDIYPLYFEEDPEGLYAEVERIVRFWMDRGIRIFRVDNPHTKPLWLWDRLIASVNTTDPDVLFLAEAFTKPPMMKALAEIGFQQSYTYFTWRNTKTELIEYLSELAGPASAYMRPNFFANTPDILHEYLQHGGPAAFSIRATLAATLSPTYGIYSGFELFEHVALRPGSEEYLDSEKYQYRPRDWDQAIRQGRSLAPYLTMLNRIRRAHPALQDLRSLHFHHTDNDDIIAFSKRSGTDTILVTCLLDPRREQSTTVWWDMDALGLQGSDRFVARDEITSHTWTWGAQTYVHLRPWENVAHIVSVTTR